MKQCRNTKQKQLVLDAVKSRHDHPTADQVYLDLRQVDDKISRGTVYRNLNFWAEQGEIIRVKVSNAERYDCRNDLHHHLICTKCGKLSDLEVDYNNQLDQEIEKQTGYRNIKHRIVYEGICPSCSKLEKD